MKSIPSRGLQDIHTMSERISEADNPQRKYLALAMLELEKARRNKEKQSAIQRVCQYRPTHGGNCGRRGRPARAAKRTRNASVPAKQPAARRLGAQVRRAFKTRLLRRLLGAISYHRLIGELVRRVLG